MRKSRYNVDYPIQMSEGAFQGGFDIKKCDAVAVRNKKFGVCSLFCRKLLENKASLLIYCIVDVILLCNKTGTPSFGATEGFNKLKMQVFEKS